MQCTWCKNSYYSSGGYTRHLQSCPVKLHEEMKLAASANRTVINVTHIDNSQHTTYNLTLLNQIVVNESAAFERFLLQARNYLEQQRNQAPITTKHRAQQVFEQLREAAQRSPDRDYQIIARSLGELSVPTGVDDKLAGTPAQEVIIANREEKVLRTHDLIIEELTRDLSPVEKQQFLLTFESSSL